MTSAPADVSAVLLEAERVAQTPPPSLLDRAPSTWTGPALAYYSIGKYAWPDPSTPDGLPYRRIDCAVNPDSAGPAYDRTRLAQFVDGCRTLVLADLLHRDARWTQALARRLHAWFVDPATAMEPHLRHAAALPGVNDGMWVGLIEGARLIALVDDLEALTARRPQQHEALAAAVRGTRVWMGRFAHWYRTSEQGRRDAASTNNHGLWYHLQTLTWAGFADPDDGALPDLRAQLATAVGWQVGADGSLPQELARENALGYVVFTLLAIAAATERLEPHGLDVLAEPTLSGACVRDAFTWLLENAADLRGEPDQGGEPGRRAVLAWWIAERFPAHPGVPELLERWGGTASPAQRARRALGLRDWC